MIGLLKSELYKLFTRKSFYVCAIIMAILSGFAVWGTEATYNYSLAQYGIPNINLKQIGFTGLDAVVYNLSSLGANASFICAIFSSLFVCSEFSSGMIKSLSIRGKNRMSIYASKLIVSMLIPVVYALIFTLVSYSVGAYLFGFGTWKDEYLNNGLFPIGFFLLANMVLQSIYVMMGYVFASSVWVTAINLCISMSIIPGLLSSGIDYILRTWFGLNINTYRYWIVTNTDAYICPLKGEFAQILPWVLISYFVVSTAIGMFVFKKKEIK